MVKNLLFFTVVLLLVGTLSVQAQEKKYAIYGIGFYDLENLFDTVHDEGYNDYEYLPGGREEPVKGQSPVIPWRFKKQK